MRLRLSPLYMRRDSWGQQSDRFSVPDWGPSALTARRDGPRGRREPGGCPPRTRGGARRPSPSVVRLIVVELRRSAWGGRDLDGVRQRSHLHPRFTPTPPLVRRASAAREASPPCGPSCCGRSSRSARTTRRCPDCRVLGLLPKPVHGGRDCGGSLLVRLARFPREEQPTPFCAIYFEKGRSAPSGRWRMVAGGPSGWGIPRMPLRDVGPEISTELAEPAGLSTLLLDLTNQVIWAFQNVEHRGQGRFPDSHHTNPHGEERKGLGRVLVQPAEGRQVSLVKALGDPNDSLSLQACEVCENLAKMVEVGRAPAGSR